MSTFPSLVWEFSSNHSNPKLLHCRIRPLDDLLSHMIKRLLPAFPPRMTRYANFAFLVCNPLRNTRVIC